MLIKLCSNTTYTADEVWNVLEDILDSVRLAETSATGCETGEIWATVESYAINQYGLD